MTNAMKQITFSLIGTLLGLGIAAAFAADWVDYKINEVSRMVDHKINHITTAPARAATNAWEAMKQAASGMW